MEDKKIVLFHPNLPVSARDRARDQMDSRWLGQGPLVDEFEIEFEKKVSQDHKAIAVNSGTSALHLAYILAGIGEGDEVITPIFTCSATPTPLLYQKAKVLFADINEDNLNINPDHVEELLKVRGERIKAIVTVDYGGFPCDYDRLLAICQKWNIPLIEDAAQAIGAKYHGVNVGTIAPFTAFSFQAVKTITTTDGGMLTIGDPLLEEKAKRIRWFGIDRKAKFEDRWKKDIFETGYKYQMTDVEAAMGLEGLKLLDQFIAHSKELFETYQKSLAGINGIKLLVPPHDYEDDGTDSSYWLCTVEVDRREDLKRKLEEHNIESDPVHYRNDRYTVFGGRVYNCPNMDYMEDRYLVLPMHSQMNISEVEKITGVIKSGW